MRCKNRNGFSLLAALLALAWAAPGAAESGCLLQQDSKVCLDVTSDPAGDVQPSQQGGTPTYVKYTATLRNVSLKSTRFVTLNLAMDPAVETAEFVADARLACTRTGSNASCFVDKASAGEPMAVAWTVKAPTTEGTLTGTGLFGWNGRTSTVSHAVQVVQDSGRTHVPANTSGITIVTAPPAEDQVTPENPLYAEIMLPAKPYPYSAKVSVIVDGPTAESCVGGLFLSATDGGPYVCRTDIPGRWIEVDIDLPAEHAADPFQYGFQMQWDASIVPALQLPPTDVAPTGTPPFAVFYAENSTPPPTGFRAFSAQCETAAPPCLTDVHVNGFGDWVASGEKPSDNPNVVAANAPLAPLYAVLEFLMNSAFAGPLTIDPPDIMK